MAKHRDERMGNEGNGIATEYVCEQGRWEYVESHLGSLKLQTSGKRPPVVIGRDVLQPTNENGQFLKSTAANPNGFRYWQRRVVLVMQEGQSVSDYLDELEKFDAATVLVFTEQTYVQGKTQFHIHDGVRQSKSYKVMVDAKGQPVSKEVFHKLMLEAAITLANQKHMQVRMRAKAEELYDELQVERPIAGQRVRQSTPQKNVESEMGEGMDE